MENKCPRPQSILPRVSSLTLGPCWESECSARLSFVLQMSCHHLAQESEVAPTADEPARLALLAQPGLASAQSQAQPPSQSVDQGTFYRQRACNSESQICSETQCNILCQFLFFYGMPTRNEKSASLAKQFALMTSIRANLLIFLKTKLHLSFSSGRIAGRCCCKATNLRNNFLFAMGMDVF